MSNMLRRFAGGIGLAGLGCVMALSGCSLSPGSGTTFDAKSYEGVYVGTWTNEAAGASGEARIEIQIDEEAKVATMIIDFDGNYLGLGDPPAQELTGNFNDDGAQLDGESELFGQYNVIVGPDGATIGVFRGVGQGAIPLLTYSGALTSDSLDADYNAVTADGQTLTAVVQLTKE